MEERNTPDESRIRNVRRRLFQHSLDNDDGEDDNIVNRLLEEDHKQRELVRKQFLIIFNNFAIVDQISQHVHYIKTNFLS